MNNRIVVGITGASGAVYGVELLRALREAGGIETHLVVSRTARITLAHETGLTLDAVEKLADHSHNAADLAASISSGSFLTRGMVVAPCSMKSLAEIALGLSHTLLTRAADVTLKERRRLVLLPRETPLNAAHLKHMLAVTEMGGIIAPPVPAFYNQPQSLHDTVRHTVHRVLDLFDIPNANRSRWQGLKTDART